MATATTPTPKKSRTAAAKAATPGLIDLKAANRAAVLFKNLGDPTRVRVLLLLAEGERNVTDLCAAMGQSQPATSHHLALCRHGGVIECNRRGKNNYYLLTDKGRMLAETARKLMDADVGR
jgi:DNA-binding transcriptional ArsR family regulator